MRERPMRTGIGILLTCWNPAALHRYEQLSWGVYPGIPGPQMSLLLVLLTGTQSIATLWLHHRDVRSVLPGQTPQLPINLSNLSEGADV